jgi:ABC-type microcin C transport system duplicated ATPase subunit YejF
MIFQDPFGSLNPRMPVAKIIAEGLEARGDLRPAVLAAPRHPYTRELLDAIPHLHAPGTVTTPTAATTT